MFIAVFKANPGMAAVRAAKRAEHDAYWEPRMGKIRIAGPILEDDRVQRCGQILILDVESKEEVALLVTEDPYVQAGLFEDYEIRPFRISVCNGETL